MPDSLTSEVSRSADATMAVFLDLENIALGAKTANFPPFDINLVLERLLLRGDIVVKKAYCDFARYKEFKKDLHEAAFELIEIPHVRQSGKNSADIRMVVDALDLCYTKQHLDTFVILSGDSDFSPLVSKLRENAKTVIGVGVKSSSSSTTVTSSSTTMILSERNWKINGLNPFARRIRSSWTLRRNLRARRGNRPLTPSLKRLSLWRKNEARIASGAQ
jgi:uncharacterized protein (TIGR00288 family)